MPPLMEMLLNTHGNSFSDVGSRLGLSADQSEQAMAALMPAFAQSLKRNAADPTGMGRFVAALASGRHQQYGDDPSAAFTRQGTLDGNGILGHLFGSKDVSRAVAAHAAQSTGISSSILKQLLPVIASMVMGGLFKQSTGNVRGGGGRAGGGILGQIMEQVLAPGAGRNAPRRGSGPDNPLGDILGQVMGGSGAAKQPTARQGDKLGKIFEEMFSGDRKSNTREQANPGGILGELMKGGRDPFDNSLNRRQQPRQSDRLHRQHEARDGGLPDLFGEMFDSGRPVEEKYQQGVESIFDGFLDNMKG